MRRTSAVALCVVVAALLVASAAYAATTTFSNSDDITVNDGGTCTGGPSTAPGSATPYPSEIAVSGIGDSVVDVNVTINGLSHPFPDDVGLLLVSPADQSATLMTDSGGGRPGPSGVDLTFDDEAAGALPNEGPLASGSYLPSRGTTSGAVCSAPTSFPDPAPASPYGSSLSVFDGSDPNGTWKLYVVDDSAGDAGSISGWSLEITDEGPTVAVARGGHCKPTEGGAPAGTINLVVADAESDPADLALSAASSNQAVVPDDAISFGGTGARRTLTAAHAAPAGGGTSTITVEVSDGELTSTIPIGVTVGTRARDVLVGSARAAMLFPRGGNDAASGGGANDLICGGAGDDVVRGQSGDDTLRADGGEDTLSGGVGADFLAGGPGTDTATDFEAGQGDKMTGIP